MNDTPGTTTLVEARIDTDEGGLVSLPPYRIPEAKRQQVKKELVKLVKQGILVKRESRLSFPMMLVNKPDGSIRLCGDYRQINLITPQWHAYIPLLAEILERIGRAQILTKLDLKKGFHKVLLDEGTREKTTITTCFGH